jgi:hypothetical protein
MLLVTWGVFGNLMFLLWFALWGWFICLLGRGSFHFVPCILPFFGALVYLWLAGFHHLFFFLICFLRRAEGLGTWCCPCGLPSKAVHLSSWMWVLPFCSLFSPFLGAFVNLWLTRFYQEKWQAPHPFPLPLWKKEY